MANKALTRRNGGGENSNDELFTRFNDIAIEVKNYLTQFIGKHILCPCDWNQTICDWKHNNPEKYKEWIEWGGIKYSEAIRCNFVRYLESQAKSYDFEVHYCGYYPNETKNLDGLTPFQKSIPEYTKKYGAENLVVITNPPFSLSAEWLKVLLECKVHFLFIGPMTSIDMYLDKIIQNKIWLGYTQPKIFNDEKGQEFKFGNICWFTNLDVTKRDVFIKLCYDTKTTKYDTIDGTDCLFIEKTKYIPNNYSGLMAVPYSFLFNYNPAQFQIYGSSNKLIDKKVLNSKNYSRNLVHGKRKFIRLFIKNKSPKNSQIDW